MRELANFPIKGEARQFLAVTKFCEPWTDNKTELKITLDKTSLKLDITFVLNNCFSNFGNLPLTQHFLWQIYFHTIMKINSYQILKKRFT